MSLGLPGRAVWAAPCHWDCWRGRRLGGVVSLGLRGRASSWWRCVIEIVGSQNGSFLKAGLEKNRNC